MNQQRNTEVEIVIGRSEFHTARVFMDFETNKIIHHDIVVRPEIIKELQQHNAGDKQALVELIKEDSISAYHLNLDWLTEYSIKPKAQRPLKKPKFNEEKNTGLTKMKVDKLKVQVDEHLEKEPTPKYKEVICTALSKEQKKKLQQLAKARGLCVSTYLREFIQILVEEA